MSDVKTCDICECYGRDKKRQEDVRCDKLFTSNVSIKITLCKAHSIELFKKGQIPFLLDHRDILNSKSNDQKVTTMLSEVMKMNKVL